MSKCKITNWLSNLFENKKSRKEHNHLTREDIMRLEKSIDMYNKYTICEHFNISANIYYKVKNRRHKYSSYV